MKKSRALKRGLCVAWMLACVLGSLVTAHAASAKGAAMADYKTFMAGQGSYLEFGVIYLDKDTIPELVLNNGRIYTWKKASGMKLLQDDYEFDYQKYYTDMYNNR